MSPEDGGRVGILAGGGALPGILVEACRVAGPEPFVVAFNGFADPALAQSAEAVWVDLGAVNATLELLRGAACSAVVLAGSVRRPRLSALRADGRGARLIARAALARGDDALLRLVVEELEHEGFRVVGPDHLLASLLATPGPLGGVAPGPAHLADIALGVDAARALGEADLGQAVVVCAGAVVATETAAGTDALLNACRGVASGGVLVKASKPGQERRVDLPAIGEDTVAGAAAAGLEGIAVEAGAALVVDRRGVVAAADAAGLFVYGFDSADPGAAQP